MVFTYFSCQYNVGVIFVCLQSSSEENDSFSLNMLLAGEYQFKLQCPAGMQC